MCTQKPIFKVGDMVVYTTILGKEHRYTVMDMDFYNYYFGNGLYMPIRNQDKLRKVEQL